MKSTDRQAGFLITLEGGEGSGKSTLLNQLADFLTSQGYSVIKTREPGGSKLGEMIRQLLLNKHEGLRVGYQAELLLFLAARAQHIEELIQPALQAGQIVLCDRFNDSTIAYQGAARGLSSGSVEQLCQLVCGPLQPHLTLWLDVNPSIGLQRTQKLSKENAESGQFDRIESETLGFHQRVQQGFAELAKKFPERIYRLDAQQPQEVVKQQAIEKVSQLLGLTAVRHERG